MIFLVSSDENFRKEACTYQAAQLILQPLPFVVGLVKLLHELRLDNLRLTSGLGMGQVVDENRAEKSRTKLER